jgi:tetratricopeptide (TPR) repeat protein
MIAFLATLTVYDHEHTPREFGMSLNDIGIVFHGMGERSNSIPTLESAAESYRAAISAYIVDRMRLDWSLSQYSLGNVLRDLEKRERKDGRLEEAVAACRAALQVQTRELLPVDWAMTYNNLGTTLWALGERESGTARLKEARDAFELARLGYREGGMPGYNVWFEDRLKALDKRLRTAARGSQRLA